MRTIPNSPIHTASKMTAAGATAVAKATFSPPAATIHRSPWHSPVPYLFGGLAAMLGLIAFALLILACSYWKHSSDGDQDVERGGNAEKGESSGEAKPPVVYEEKFLVIMAGEVRPTFLATHVCSKNSSFNEDKSVRDENDNHKDATTSSSDGDGAESAPAPA